MRGNGGTYNFLRVVADNLRKTNEASSNKIPNVTVKD